MNSREIKALQDEVLDLRKKVVEISNFGQEKDRMLCTIALLTAKLGGIATVDSGDDAAFIRDWNAGRIIMNVEQSLANGGLVTFMVMRHKEASDANDQGAGGAALPGDAGDAVQSGAGALLAEIPNG